MRCLASAKFSMLVDILKPQGAPTDSSDPNGHWEWVQDPDSGAFVQVWVTEADEVPCQGCSVRKYPGG
jgi:hypothetical protein